MAEYINVTLTEMFNICAECVYCPSLCGRDPEICVKEYEKRMVADNG